MHTITRVLTAGGCLFGLLGDAFGQDAREFWRNEWQRQQPYQSGWGQGWGRPAYPEQRGWHGGQQAFGYQSGYQSWAPDETPRARSGDGWGPGWTPRRKMPTLRVSNPDFYNYTPDPLANMALDAVCAFKTAAGGQTTPDNATPNSTAPANAAPDGAATPAEDASFVQACGSAPSISLRTLQPVGAALIRHYAEHPKFLWSEQGRLSPKAETALATLAASDAVGLDPADYRVALPDLERGDASARQLALLRFDLALSAKVLTYVLDATRGRIDPNRISGYHDLPRKSVDLAAALGAIAQTSDVAAYLRQQNPDNAQFRALTAELARLRANAGEAGVALPESTVIRPGDSHAQLAAVATALRRAGSERLRHKYREALAAPPQTYSGALVEAVKAFQAEKGLPANGVIGAKTIRALAADAPQDRLAKLRIALEQLRWLPRELGTRYVFLNQPAFEVTYVNGSAAPLIMRAVIGKPDSQTYFFSHRIKEVVYNPYWNVPRSILINEMLPKLWRDPSWLNRQGYEVVNNRGREVASSAVDWSAVVSDQLGVDVRQPPGRGNALGQLKIEFPNKHAIYMHDTPQKHLFAREQRAFSHGCVRLQQPRELAAALLGVSVADIDRKIATGDNRTERVAGDIPVYLAYFTAWPDTQGHVRYYGDVYSRDAHVLQAIAKTEAARRAL